MDAHAHSQTNVTTSKVIERLNSHQRMTLKEIEMLGWWLNTIRHPAYPEPAIVVVCETGCPIGLLDALGKIVPDRTLKPAAGSHPASCEEAGPADTDPLRPGRVHEYGPEVHAPATAEIRLVHPVRAAAAV